MSSQLDPKVGGDCSPVALMTPSSVGATYLTIGEVMADTRIKSRSTIYGLIHSGQLEAVKIGSATRITGASYSRFKNGLCQLN